MLNLVKSLSLSRNISKSIISVTSQRHLSLHEYQSKKLLEENGVNVQRFRIASNEDEAFEAGKVLSNNQTE